MLLWHISTITLVENYMMPEWWVAQFLAEHANGWRVGVWAGVGVLVSGREVPAWRAEGIVRLLTGYPCGRFQWTVCMRYCVWTGGVRFCTAEILVVVWEMRVGGELRRRGVWMMRRQ
jgi:hypothetical protein